jgi:hypothetical protein
VKKEIGRLDDYKSRININIRDCVKVARSMNACTHKKPRVLIGYDSISSQAHRSKNKKLSKSLDGSPVASSTKCTLTRDRIAAGSDKAYFLFNKKNYYGFL